jgi:putative restriction endonuclease
MAKGVFTTKVVPSYDDLLEERYHFPRTYLKQVEATLGDTIAYYEPRRDTENDASRGGRQAYFALARPIQIYPDPRLDDHFYCDVEGYLNLTRTVGFREGANYFESALQKEDGSTNKGAFGRSVRIVPEEEFEEILAAGLTVEDRPFIGGETTPHIYPGVEELDVPFERPMVELTTLRPFRDLAFRRNVRAAYDNQCALTGLRLINGGGRPEVQAAHIRPVSAHGPDSVRNGLALSGTIHWLFDRGLVSIDDDLSILKAKGKIPPEVDRLLSPSGKIFLPKDASLAPHPLYLRHHREHCFKG